MTEPNAPVAGRRRAAKYLILTVGETFRMCSVMLDDELRVGAGGYFKEDSPWSRSKYNVGNGSTLGLDEVGFSGC